MNCIKKRVRTALVVPALAAALVATGARAAGPELVLNGGFDSGDFTGWTATPSNGATLFGVDDQGPRTGNFAAYFGGLVPFDTISQSFATTSGASYRVSFLLDSQVSATQGAELVARFGGTTVLDVTQASGSFALRPYSFTVAATGSQTALSFAAYNDYDFYTLDDVSVTLANGVAAPVPEPTGWALLAGGLGLVALVRRRSRGAVGSLPLGRPDGCGQTAG